MDMIPIVFATSCILNFFVAGRSPSSSTAPCSTCKVLVVVADHDAEDSRDVVALCSLSSSAALSSTSTVPFDVDHDTGSCRFVVVVVFSMTTPLTQVLAFRLQNSTRVVNEGPSSCELSEADVRSMVKFPTSVTRVIDVGVGGTNQRARMGVGLERCRSVKASVTQTVACGCRRRSATSKGQNEKLDERVLKVYAFCGRLWMRPGSHDPTSLAHTCGARVLDAKQARVLILELAPDAGIDGDAVHRLLRSASPWLQRPSLLRRRVACANLEP
ncbi:hypothetical protein DFP72DRAFT_1069202 [Ephemerocybe angulata]|uniref:Secreted protein n=1 Tax=Ephemerocybe angulata TaxID=980116 RepID=A0A8H6HVK3_9AGAR|nr:hypothetical protein DFP72DRAFT_1069202 [Tulosesus angulatus]